MDPTMIQCHHIYITTGTDRYISRGNVSPYIAIVEKIQPASPSLSFLFSKLKLRSHADNEHDHDIDADIVSCDGGQHTAARGSPVAVMQWRHVCTGI